MLVNKGYNMKQELNLRNLLQPEKIAVIGASEKPNKVGNIVFQFLNNSSAQLYPVHPKESHVYDHKVTNSIRDLPDGIDMAVITIPADKAVYAAKECAKKGIPILIIMAGGFAETSEEGKKLEKALQEIPQQHKSRVLGPNSLGLFIPSEKLDTIFVEHGDKALAEGGNVAFITQSGSVGVEALGLASNTGFGMRAFIGLGNKCDLNENDFLHYFGQDKETSCLAFYLENFEDGRAFLQEAKEISHSKPVVVLKAGRTQAGVQAISSHTGRLAGSDQVISGAFRQYGIIRAFDEEEICDASKTLSMLPPASGNRIAVVTAAGGYGVISADYIETTQRNIKLEMAKLSEETKSRIQTSTLSYAACNNPIDLTASASDAMFGETLDALIADEQVDIILCMALFAPHTITENLIQVIARCQQNTGKAIIAMTQYGPFTDKYIKDLHEAGVLGFPSVHRMVRGARFLVERAEILKALKDG